jgi:hypothetical protein
MKDRLTTIKPLLVALALLAQLALAAAAPPAPQNTNSTTSADKQNTNVGIPYNRKCRSRCDRAYRLCVRGKNVRSCRRQLRNCLRRCPQ